MSLVKSEIEENNELVNNLIYPTENRTITQRIVKNLRKLDISFMNSFYSIKRWKKKFNNLKNEGKEG